MTNEFSPEFLSQLEGLTEAQINDQVSGMISSLPPQFQPMAKRMFADTDSTSAREHRKLDPVGEVADSSDEDDLISHQDDGSDPFFESVTGSISDETSYSLDFMNNPDDFSSVGAISPELADVLRFAASGFSSSGAVMPGFPTLKLSQQHTLSQPAQTQRLNPATLPEAGFDPFKQTVDRMFDHMTYTAAHMIGADW